MNTENEEVIESDQTVAQRNQMLVGYGLVFSELLKNEKFQAFVELHFTIQKLVDDEAKSIELRVIENPPEVVLEKLKAAGMFARQEDTSRIEVVGSSKAAQVIKMAERKAARNRKH